MTILLQKSRKKNKSKSSTESEVYSISNDILMYSKRVVVLLSLQKQILKEFHIEHPCISRMKRLMRSYVYWRSMDRDIENLVKSCKGCDLAAKQIKFNPWPETNCQWSCLYIGFTGLLNGSLFDHCRQVFQEERDIEMQETNHGSSNWVSTIAAKVWGDIYIKRIQMI